MLEGATDGTLGYLVGRWGANSLSPTGYAERMGIKDATRHALALEKSAREVAENTLNASNGEFVQYTAETSFKNGRQTAKSSAKGANIGGGSKNNRGQIRPQETKAQLRARIDQEVRTTNRKTMAQSFYEASYALAGKPMPEINYQRVPTYGFTKW